MNRLLSTKTLYFRLRAMMRWGDKAKNDDHYLLLESQKEFKKDSRRVAIKVTIVLMIDY